MIDLKVSRTINAPIDEVWRVIADDFAQSHRWAFGTSTCRPGRDGEPFDRVCETETGRLEDTITTLDADAHLLEFTVTGLPFFVRNVVSTWTLDAVSDTQTTLTFGPRIETMPIIGHLMEIPMRKALDKLYPELLEDLTVFIETGAPSARKQEELAGRH